MSAAPPHRAGERVRRHPVENRVDWGDIGCGGLYRRIPLPVAGLPARKIDCVAVYDKQINVKRGHRVIELAVKYYF